jgi:hypothetical protein
VKTVCVSLPSRAAIAALVLLSSLGFIHESAACNQGVANQSQADRDWWRAHGCQSAFVQWQYRAYDMDSDWRGSAYGWTDACNQLRDFPKFWSAAYLVTYGLADDYENSFHFASGDYRPTAEAPTSRFHNAIEHMAPTNDTSILGRWSWDPFGSNDVQLSCLLFDPMLTLSNANAASRAGDFMHEAWHDWTYKYGFNGGPNAGHRPSQGNCTINACDYFYFHGVSAYQPGAMWETTRTAARFHSPNQVQVEFLCDVADYPARNVPASLRMAARGDANQRAVQRFINGPGYSCGTPRPW